MKQRLPILKWLLRLIGLAPRRVGQALATGFLMVALSTMTVLFGNLAAGDDLLLQQAVRYSKLVLILITVAAVATIIGLCLFLLMKQSFGDEQSDGQ